MVYCAKWVLNVQNKLCHGLLCKAISTQTLKRTLDICFFASERVDSMSNGVICPATKFQNIEYVLHCLEPEGRLKVNQIASRLNQSISWINNALPIMEEMGLTWRNDLEKGYIGITGKGRELARALDEKDEDKIKEIGRQIYKNSSILRYAYELLLDNPKVNNVNLGQELIKKLEIPPEQRWKSPATYRYVGRTCKYILAGLKLIKYNPPTRKKRSKKAGKFKNKLMPYASANLMFELFDNEFDDKDFFKLPSDEITRFQRQRKLDYINSSIGLGLVESVKRDEYTFKLTDAGKIIKDTNDLSERSLVFQNILLQSLHVVELIKIVKNKYNGIYPVEMGSVLSEYNETNWGEKSKDAYGHNFLNWLKVADIIEKHGMRGKYVLRQSFLQSDTFKKYFSNELTEKKEIQQTSSKNQLNLITIKQPSLSIDTITIFDTLIKHLNWIFYFEDYNPYADEKKHQEIMDIFDQLIYSSQGEARSILSMAKYLTNLAYKESDREHIKQCLKHLASIKIYNKSSIDT